MSLEKNMRNIYMHAISADIVNPLRNAYTYFFFSGWDCEINLQYESSYSILI